MADVVVLALVLWGCTIVFSTPWRWQYSTMALLVTVMFYLTATVGDLYRSWRGAGLRAEAMGILRVWVWVVLALLLVAYATKTSVRFSRLVVMCWFLAAPTALLLMRVVVRLWLHRIRKVGRNNVRVVIAGAGRLGINLARAIEDQPSLGIQIIGFYDDNLPVGHKPDSELDYPVLGTLDQMMEHAHRRKLDHVFLTLPTGAEQRIHAVLHGLAQTAVSVYLIPNVFVFDLAKLRWTQLAGFPMAKMYGAPIAGMDGWAKRAVDVVLSALIVAMISPLMLAVAIGIKLTSKGPVFFKQTRYGLGGKDFSVWKFRTMAVCEAGEQAVQATKNDPRVTRFGSFLRRTSLDELPQFINVLQGVMSIVGPRPHPTILNEKYRKLIPGYMVRHTVRPGITGWAQINGWRGETDTDEKMVKRVEHDLEYIRNWSLLMDLKIIAVTCYKGFVNRNAY